MEALSVNRVDAVSALADRLREDLYRLVAASDHPLSRDEAAAALALPRSTAAFHLDRLVEVGLLAVEHRRLSGRSGPGAGRPTKLYSAIAADVLASVPERHYELAGELLASSIERADREGVPVREALDAEAHALGLSLASGGTAAEDALSRCGYSPADDGRGGLTLDNCPFHALASRHTPLMCGANLALVQGVLDGTGDDRQPSLEPAEGRCCVAIHGARQAPGTPAAQP
jgi:predicted ArsR family transcriptional regulator